MLWICNENSFGLVFYSFLDIRPLRIEKKGFCNFWNTLARPLEPYQAWLCGSVVQQLSSNSSLETKIPVAVWNPSQLVDAGLLNFIVNTSWLYLLNCIKHGYVFQWYSKTVFKSQSRDKNTRSSLESTSIIVDTWLLSFNEYKPLKLYQTWICGSVMQQLRSNPSLETKIPVVVWNPPQWVDTGLLSSSEHKLIVSFKLYKHGYVTQWNSNCVQIPILRQKYS